jgi:hypothetical protein
LLGLQAWATSARLSWAFTTNPVLSSQVQLPPICRSSPVLLSLAFLCRGGAELLFDGVKKHQVTLPGQEEPCEYWLFKLSVGSMDMCGSVGLLSLAEVGVGRISLILKS